MKKLLEIECCLECPNSNIATTACMLKGGRSLLPDNVVLNRTIPEWCPLETKLKTLTDEEINYKMEKMLPCYTEIARKKFIKWLRQKRR